MPVGTNQQELTDRYVCEGYDQLTCCLLNGLALGLPPSVYFPIFLMLVSLIVFLVFLVFLVLLVFLGLLMLLVSGLLETLIYTSLADCLLLYVLY